MTKNIYTYFNWYDMMTRIMVTKRVEDYCQGIESKKIQHLKLIKKKKAMIMGSIYGLTYEKIYVDILED